MSDKGAEVKWDGHCIRLGEAVTIGELRSLIKNYPDETSFGFRNQPLQALHEVRHGDKLFVVFQ